MSRKAFTADDAALTMNFIGFAFRRLREQGLAAEALLDGTGLTAEAFADPGIRCRFWQHQRFLRNAMAATADPHLGPRLALEFDINNIGLPAYAAMSSASFAAALEVADRYFFMTFPIIDLDREILGEEVVLRWRPSLTLGETAYFVIGGAVVMAERFFRALLRLDRVLTRAEFAFAEPAGWPAFAAQQDGPVASFGASESRAFFPKALLDRPLASADPINHQNLLALCAQQAARTEFEESFSRQVLAYMSEQRPLNPSLDAAAAAFGYSERSFRRKLERSGVSFRQLCDQLRESRAREMLCDTMLSVQAIAFELGFNEPSNFARSFKRWTGVTPKAYREGRRSGRN